MLSREASALNITAESAILMNSANKRAIYSKHPHKKLAPASTIKIMTAILTLRKSNIKDKVTVSKHASSMEPSKVYVKEGENYTVEDLLKAILLNSGNDASLAIAEHVSGSEDGFVKDMNALARQFGAKNTIFKTSNGLPKKGQYSTAYDLALIMRQCMKNEKFIDIIKMKNSQMEELNSGRVIKLRNHNKSLRKEKPYLILGKTGYTKKAGHCFAGYIQYGKRNKTAIVVILKSKSLWKDLEMLAESLKR